MTFPIYRALLPLCVAVSMQAASIPLVKLSTAHAGEIAWSQIETEFEITVTALSSVRTFSKNCNLDAEKLANTFVSTFANVAGIDRAKVEERVAFGLKVAQSLHSTECKLDDLQVYMKLFNSQSNALFRSVAKYSIQKY
jgi:hypothetical protein